MTDRILDPDDDIPEKLTPKDHRQIDTVLNAFDFKRVEDFMKATDWKWGTPHPPHIPNQDELQKTARMLLENVLPGKGSIRSSCGGFTASIERMEEGPTLRLVFIITASEATIRE